MNAQLFINTTAINTVFIGLSFAKIEYTGSPVKHRQGI